MLCHHGCCPHIPFTDQYISQLFSGLPLVFNLSVGLQIGVLVAKLTRINRHVYTEPSCYLGTNLYVLTWRPQRLAFQNSIVIAFNNFCIVGREGLEPPEAEATWFTVRTATNYGIPTQIWPMSTPWAWFLVELHHPSTTIPSWDATQSVERNWAIQSTNSVGKVGFEPTVFLCNGFTDRRHSAIVTASPNLKAISMCVGSETRTHDNPPV